MAIHDRTGRSVTQQAFNHRQLFGETSGGTTVTMLDAPVDIDFSRLIEPSGLSVRNPNTTAVTFCIYQTAGLTTLLIEEVCLNPRRKYVNPDRIFVDATISALQIRLVESPPEELVWRACFENFFNPGVEEA